MNIALLLIIHNSAAWLEPLAASWRAAMSQTPQLHCEIVIADSGSTDNTLALAPTAFPAARVLPLNNVGFGTAANRAAEATTSPWLLLCNPDITFPADFSQTFILPALADPQHACFAPRLLNSDGSPQPSVGRFFTVRQILRDQFRPREHRKYSFPQPTQPGPVDWATGACLLIRRDAFRAVGGFDEKYFLYVEEVDLQRRLAARGFPTCFLPQAALTHHNPNAGRAPRPEVQRYAARGTLRYFARFAPASLALYRMLALVTGRLSFKEATASRSTILQKPTGP